MNEGHVAPAPTEGAAEKTTPWPLAMTLVVFARACLMLIGISGEKKDAEGAGGHGGEGDQGDAGGHGGPGSGMHQPDHKTEGEGHSQNAPKHPEPASAAAADAGSGHETSAPTPPVH